MAQKAWVNELRNPPIQYQRGWTEFYKLKFKLTPDVLIPRPETELLVDEVVAYAKQSNHPERSLRTRRISNKLRDSSPAAQNDKDVTIIDIGTGSGCIAISIAKNLPNAKIFALDISEKALKIAKENASFHKVQNQILFIQSDLLSSVIASEAKQSSQDNIPPTKIAMSPSAPRNDGLGPDVIVANLPYIPSAKLMLIDPMVRDFEPKIALDGGIDGFDLYRKLFQQLSGHLEGVATVPPGRWNSLAPKVLICEIDEEQGEIALQEAQKYFSKAKAEVKKDFYGADRMLLIR